MKTIFQFIFILCVFTSQAQIEATTKDGKKVLLNKNGTWKYAKTKTNNTATTPSAVETVPADALKKEAEDFALKIVATYFTNECEPLLSMCSPSLITTNGPVALTEVSSKKLCESTKRAVKDKSKSLKDYTDNYNYKIITCAELESMFKVKLAESYNSSEPNFVFAGGEMKPNATTTSFIWDDVYYFLVRKTAGKWELKGFFD